MIYEQYELLPPVDGATVAVIAIGRITNNSSFWIDDVCLLSTLRLD